MNKKVHLIYALSFLAIIILCVITIIFNNLRTDQNYAIIYVDGKPLRQIEWSTLTEQISIPAGDGNTVCADRSGVWMEHADCPDQLCVKQGKIHSGNLSIICLPNRVTVTLTSETTEWDGVAS